MWRSLTSDGGFFGWLHKPPYESVVVALVVVLTFYDCERRLGSLELDLWLYLGYSTELSPVGTLICNIWF